MSNSYDFWDLVHLGGKDLSSFLQKLSEMSEVELVRFYWDHGTVENELYKAGLKQHMGEWGSENTLMWLAEWIVDQGIDYYDDVLEDISVAPQRFPREEEVGLRRLAETVYRKRYGTDIRFPDDPAPSPDV